MKNGRLFWGILLVTVGLLFLLSNLFDITLDLGDIFKFWPLALILFGVSVFIKNELSKTIIACLAAVIVGIIIFSVVIRPFSCIKEHTKWDEWEELKDVKLDTLNFPVPKESSIIDLKLEGGATSFYINEIKDTSFLYTLIGYNLTQTLDLTNEMGLDNYRVIIAGKDKEIIWPDKWKGNKLTLGLNQNLIYNLSCDLGASKADFNLRNIKVMNLDINTGASSFDLKLGEPVGDTLIVDIEAGASSMDIKLPVNVSGEIYSDLSISKKSFNGFKKINNHYYQTENFSSQKKRIILRIDGGITSINVSFE
ncbi:MAG: DUF5668 domain-containing protein [Ignavibacteriaceae bacterium]